MDTPCLLVEAITGLTAAENDAALLPALTIPTDSAPINYTRWYIT